MSETLTVESYAGPYVATFDDRPIDVLAGELPADVHILIDARVAVLYRDDLGPALERPSVLSIEAYEANKSLEQMPSYIEHLVGNGIRRGHTLVAIGGGIIQDITCFLAATLLRGLEWHFIPTTLLAQADSCIGSKSSINVGRLKNIVGTFTPPRHITISTRFLDTLGDTDMRSGVGEMLKVHAIDGPESFDGIAADYPRLLADRGVLQHYIRQSLHIKRGIIERDEFDRGIRNVMNYGHSFGHAIESATNFGVPHGIAVTMGMDAANYVSARIGYGAEEDFERMHPVLRENYAGFEETDVPLDTMIDAMGKDKKNAGADTLRLILPDAGGRIAPGTFANDAAFRSALADFLGEVRRGA